MQEPAEAALGARFDLHAETASTSAAGGDAGVTSGSPNGATSFRPSLVNGVAGQALPSAALWAD